MPEFYKDAYDSMKAPMEPKTPCRHFETRPCVVLSLDDDQRFLVQPCEHGLCVRFPTLDSKEVVETIVHNRNYIKGGRPVCWDDEHLAESGIQASSNIDEVTCVDCLRLLAKHAVLYGRGHKPSRKW